MSETVRNSVAKIEYFGLIGFRGRFSGTWKSSERVGINLKCTVLVTKVVYNCCGYEWVGKKWSKTGERWVDIFKFDKVTWRNIKKNHRSLRDGIYADLSFKRYFVDQWVHLYDSSIVCKILKDLSWYCPFNGLGEGAEYRHPIFQRVPPGHYLLGESLRATFCPQVNVQRANSKDKRINVFITTVMLFKIYDKSNCTVNILQLP